MGLRNAVAQRRRVTQRRQTVEDVLAAGPPWFGLIGSDEANRRVSGWGGGGDDLHLSLSHVWGDGPRSVEVDTFTVSHDPLSDFDKNALIRWFSWRVVMADIEGTQFPLHFDLDRNVFEVPVDGVPVPFVMFGDEFSRVGYGTVGSRRIGLEARGVPVGEIVLGTIDPESYERIEMRQY